MISDKLISLLEDHGFDIIGPSGHSLLITTSISDRYDYTFYLDAENDRKFISSFLFYCRHRADDEHVFDCTEENWDYLINLGRKVTKTIQKKVDKKLSELDDILGQYYKTLA